MVLIPAAVFHIEGCTSPNVRGNYYSFMKWSIWLQGKHRITEAAFLMCESTAATVISLMH